MSDAGGRVRWVSLGRSGFSAVVAHFDGSPGERAVLVRGDGPLGGAAEAALVAEGFVRIPGPRTVFARQGASFTLRELRGAFPRAHAVEAALDATRARFRGSSPFAAPAAPPVEPPAPAPAPAPAAAADPAPVAPPVAALDLPVTSPAPAPAPPADPRPPEERGNRYQVPYAPASRVGTPVAMVPVNMAEATARALRRVEEAHGPIDAFVASRMGVSVEAMGRVLSPEQVDGVGMGLAAMIRRRGFILADQTGLGKGRVLAALAMCAANMGLPLVFVTEKANLFSDFWRDLVDIGGTEAVGTPFLLNDKSRVVDVTSVNGEILFEAMRPEQIRRAVKAKRLPDGCKAMFATHSQFNRVGSAKSDLLEAVAKGGIVVVDEAHNAIGDSNTAKALAPALRAAWGSVRSSATFARKAENLVSYGDVLPPSLRGEGAAEVLAKGGNALAEALSQYLAEDGVLIRREHDLSGIRIEVVVDEERRARNRALADDLAPILARMARLARVVNDEAELRNEELARECEATGRKPKENWYTANFGSRLSPLIRQFVTALSVDLCVERCVASLERGEKPVIVIESTMESLMRELAGEGGDGEDAADGAPEAPDGEDGADAPAEGAPPPDFRAALSMVLERIMQLSVKRGKEDPERVPVEEPEAVSEARAIRDLIDGFPDLSLSPIDDVRDRIEAEGRRRHEAGLIDRPWRADEISARRMRVRDGVYEVMPVADRNATIVGFNSGPIDALVITRAASTGLSLHASERARDKRRRREIELQIAKNVVERIQFWGRVNRRGQVSVPAFETLCTGLPLQMRIMAMENRKVEALSANVSASAANASAMDVPDVIDSVGNDVARRILEDRPKLAERMVIGMKVDPAEADAELYFVNKLLQRLCLLSSDEQDEVFERLLSDYSDAVAGLAAKGRGPRGLRELDGEWVEVAREAYEPGDAADGPVFGRPVELVTMEARILREPLRAADVARLVTEARARLGSSSGNAAGPFFEAQVKAIRAGRRRILGEALGSRFVSVDSALSMKGPNAVKAADERLTALSEMLRVLQPGCDVTVPSDEGELRNAVVVDVRAPEAAAEAHLPGRWTMRYAVPGEDRAREVSLATVFRDPSYTIHAARAGQVPAPRLGAFDAAPSGVVSETRKFLDGNLVKAVVAAAEAGAGSTVTIREPAGLPRRTVLVSRRGLSALRDRTTRVRDAEEAVAVLASGRGLWTDHRDRSSGARLSPDGTGAVLELPRGRAGKAFETADVLAMAGALRPNPGGLVARVPRERLARLAEALMAAGHALHFDPPPKPEEAAGAGRGRRFGRR